MTQISRDAPVGSSIIVDSPRVFGRLVWTVMLLCGGAWLLWKSRTAPDPGTAGLLVICGCAALLLFVLSVIKFRVISKGYIIDVENNVFEFPGGGIAADSWLSYFTPSYLLQGYKRHRIPLSAIREIQAYRDTSTSTYTDSQGVRRTRTHKADMLDISGDFGAARFHFASKGKRDQLHSAIVSLNKMGDPMLRR